MLKILKRAKGWLSQPIEYHKCEMGMEVKSEKVKQHLKKNKDLLSLNGINLNKIRFVNLPTFNYDVENNVVNPKFTMMIPLRKNGSKLFDNKSPVIEIDKPKNLIRGDVNCYRVDDNYGFIKELVKKSKRGIVIYIEEPHEHIHFITRKSSLCEQGVDSDILRLIDLDEISVEVIEDYEQIM